MLEIIVASSISIFFQLIFIPSWNLLSNMRMDCSIIIGIISSLVWFIFLLIVVADSGQGRTITVDDDGGEDHLSIQDAIDAANNGDIIRVFAGTYYESIVVNKSVSLVGNGSKVTTIAGGGNFEMVNIYADWVNMSGFRMSNESFNKSYSGIYLDSDYNHIFNNNCSNNTFGITISDSNNSVVANNTCSSNTEGGIVLDYSSNCTITNNSCLNNWYGIRISFHSSDNTITNNICSYNNDAISIASSDNFSLISNICSNNVFGIRLTDSNYGTILKNTCSFNSANGIYLITSNDCTIINNACSNNNNSGINLRDSSECILMNNTMNENGIIIFGNLENWNTHTFDMTNTVNGKPVHYYRNVKGFTVPAGAGQVILANCTWINVENQNCSNGSVGILVGYSSNISFSNNICSSNIAEGIFLWDSNDCTITSNICLNNEDGISLYSSENCKISDNSLLNNGKGIKLRDSGHSTIMNNTCRSNNDGMVLVFSGRCTIRDNVCSQNENNGVQLMGSSNLTISNNVVTGNRVGFYLASSSRDNSAHHNNIYNNSEFGIQADNNNGLTIKAQYNWWGKSSGPYNVTGNQNGNGDWVTGNVHFEPWLDEQGNRVYLPEDPNWIPIYILLCILAGLFAALMIVVRIPGLQTESGGLEKKSSKESNVTEFRPDKDQNAGRRITCQYCDMSFQIDISERAIRVPCPHCKKNTAK